MEASEIADPDDGDADRIYHDLCSLNFPPFGEPGAMAA